MSAVDAADRGRGAGVLASHISAAFSDDAPLARIIHEGRLMSLSSGRIEPVMARGGADDASFGFPALTRGDFGTAMSA